jgi:hypothetical protein
MEIETLATGNSADTNSSAKSRAAFTASTLPAVSDASLSSSTAAKTPEAQTI